MFHRSYYPGTLKRNNIRNINLPKSHSILSIHANSLKLPSKNNTFLIGPDKLQKEKTLIPENIYSIKKLKQLFDEQSAILHNNQKNNINEPLRSSNQQLYHGEKLPQIPAYKPISNQINKSIEQSEEVQKISQNNIQQISSDLTKSAIDKLPKKQIESQEDMINVFNSIMNGDPLKPMNTKNTDNKKEELILLSLDEIKKKNEIIIKKLKQNILDDKNINYDYFIETAYNLTQQFSKNPMIKSIILRSISQYNRVQFYKVPEDKLSEVIDIILEEIILKK